MWYCATDKATPLRAKAILAAAVAYFVLPFDFIPDLIPGLGFTDDFAVITIALKTLGSHITEYHWQKARAALHTEEPGVKETVVTG